MLLNAKRTVAAAVTFLQLHQLRHCNELVNLAVQLHFEYLVLLPANFLVTSR